MQDTLSQLLSMEGNSFCSSISKQLNLPVKLIEFTKRNKKEVKQTIFQDGFLQSKILLLFVFVIICVPRLIVSSMNT